MAEELEIVEDLGDASVDPAGGQSLAVALSRADIDQQVSTAHAYPRSLRRVASNILTLATLDDESAAECLYALPRGGKPITGPSIRFAEILAQAYGNCQAASRVMHVDRVEKYVEAEGRFRDLETNAGKIGTVRRRISTKSGKLFSEDMIIVTGNAACSIAVRNAILGGVPKPLWRKAFEHVQKTIAGDITTLSVTRASAIKAFAVYGVTPAQVFEALAVPGEEDIKVDHIPVLRGMFSALKNGESTVEEMFSKPEKQIDPDYNPLLGKKHETQPTTSSQAAAGASPDQVAPEAQRDPNPAVGAKEAAQAPGASAASTQSPKTDQPGSASQDPPGGAAAVPADRPAGTGEAAKPASPTFISISAEELKAYSEALMRAAQTKSLGALRKSFWAGKPTNFDAASEHKLNLIFQAHEERTKTDPDLASFDQRIRGIIAS